MISIPYNFIPHNMDEAALSVTEFNHIMIYHHSWSQFVNNYAVSADSRFALLCKDASHWLGAGQEVVLMALGYCWCWARNIPGEFRSISWLLIPDTLYRTISSHDMCNGNVTVSFKSTNFKIVSHFKDDNERKVFVEISMLYAFAYNVIWHDSGVIMGAIASQITSLTIVYSSVYSGADQRKHQSCASLAFVRGIHRSPVNSPHKWTVTRKMFPFDDVMMIW